MRNSTETELVGAEDVPDEHVANELPTESTDDGDIDSYVKGRALMSILRLRNHYYQTLRSVYGVSASTVIHAMVDKSDEDRRNQDKVRAAILRIGGYQTWGILTQRGDFLDRAILVAGVFGIVGLTWQIALAVVYFSGWVTVAYLALVIASSGTTLLFSFFATRLANIFIAPSFRTTRAAFRYLSFGAFVSAIWFLSNWDSIWMQAIFDGALIVIVGVVTVWIINRLVALSTLALYRHCWTKLTVDEIIETLAAAFVPLQKKENETDTTEPLVTRFPDDHLPAVARALVHVGHCIEQYLPAQAVSIMSPNSYDEDLIKELHRKFRQRATTVRLLAEEALLPKSTTVGHISTETLRLITFAAQGYWGDWNATSIDEDVEGVRRRNWLSRALRPVLALAPIILVAAGALYLSKTNPASPLLQPEVLAGSLVAAFGFFTAVLTAQSPAAKESESGNLWSKARRHE